MEKKIDYKHAYKNIGLLLILFISVLLSIYSVWHYQGSSSTSIANQMPQHGFRQSSNFNDTNPSSLLNVVFFLYLVKVVWDITVRNKTSHLSTLSKHSADAHDQLS
jgi:hypothetical protein